MMQEPDVVYIFYNDYRMLYPAIPASEDSRVQHPIIIFLFNDDMRIKHRLRLYLREDKKTRQNSVFYVWVSLFS